jgi:hypothetical protein
MRRVNVGPQSWKTAAAPPEMCSRPEEREKYTLRSYAITRQIFQLVQSRAYQVAEGVA